VDLGDDLPDKTGVYLMKDASGKVVYVGKARSIRNRVRSHSAEAMMRHVSSVDYILTETEHEALLLESNLIKRFRPRRNVRLKDDKRYPYIELTAEPFPALRITRQPGEGKCYGPFTDVGAARRTLKWVRRVFPLRSCKRLPRRPCLDYEVHLCSAPCTERITQERYGELVRGADLFLSGRRHPAGRDLIGKMHRQMEDAAQHREYERAAQIRDEIRSIERTLEKQGIVTQEREDVDVIASASSGNLACVEVLFIRSGKLVGAEHFFMEGDTKNALAAFLKQYYSTTSPPPKVLLRDHVPEDVRKWLGELGAGVRVTREGRNMKMASTNATSFLRQEGLKESKGPEELGKWLGIPSPEVIEGIDISDLGGKEAVGSVVVFRRGAPSSREYRHFRIKAKGPNDVGMMAEVVRRRYSAIEELPDLILLDGGRGQLNGARSALKGLGVDVPVLALAKEANDIFLPDKPPSRLPTESAALHLLQHVRDEAHRFAIRYHRKLRSAYTRSWLDDVPGIGVQRKRVLLERFGSLGGVKKASEDELLAVLHNRRVVGALMERR